MADYSLNNLTTAVDGTPGVGATFASSVESATFETTNGTISPGEVVNIFMGPIGSAVPAYEPDRPQIGQLYPRFEN
jgi:hypothetical protein|tara:strand:+ start:786 stop:1013 length:228 start_codon:yes stop_codon:yes gene_type:complete